jgi:L-ribulose-5-phosphate 4-epimerase
MLLEKIRIELVELHQELFRNHLVVWTGGNISSRDPETDLIAIKPSGVKYAELTPDKIVIVNLDGEIIEGNLKPSSDTLTHCVIYRESPEVNGVVHTHSRYATAFAALGQEIPCVLTGMADEFGDSIPCGSFHLIGGEDIGKEVARCLLITSSTAILLQNHGVFTVGQSAEAALKSAVMAEDAAATIWTAMQIGKPIPISKTAIGKLHHRYKHLYGQQ